MSNQKWTIDELLKIIEKKDERISILETQLAAIHGAIELVLTALPEDEGAISEANWTRLDYIRTESMEMPGEVSQ